MWDRRQFLLGSSISMLGVAAAPAPAQQQASGKSLSGNSSRASEIAALRRFAEQTHPRGLEAASNADWRQRWADLERSADRLRDGSYIVRARQALGWFGDGHTTVLPFEEVGEVPAPLKSGPFGLSLPIRARSFFDGLFVVAATDALRGMLGARIAGAGDLSVEEIIQAGANRWPGNRAWAHSWSAAPFSSPALLEAAGVKFGVGGTIRFRYVPNGADSTTEQVLAPVRGPLNVPIEIARTLTPREGWAKEQQAGNYVKPLPHRAAMYVSIDGMEDLPVLSFAQLTRETFAAMESDADRLIIDLRRNGGGDNFLGEALRKHIEASKFNRPGRLFILIAPATFSAAQNLATRLERETFATFIGEPTGGAPNHYGDAKLFIGLATGMTAIVSTIPWFDSYPSDKRPWIMPDILVPSTFGDWLRGRDRALDTALEAKSAAQLDQLSEDRIFYFGRPSQKQTWTPFWI